MLISRVTGKSNSLLASIYIFGLKPTLQRALLWSNPTTLGEAFSLAHITEARFEDGRSITDIAKTNNLNIGQQENQDNLNEIFEEKDDAKPPISTNTFGSNGGNDSRTSVSETSVEEVVENGIESEVVFGLPEEFQEGDMVDALSRVEEKSSENWKELDNESEDKKVESDAEREGELTILATFCSDRGITIWGPGIKIFFRRHLEGKVV
ncbi:hypothetical protein Tco_1302216 [Tanacetum coccineum]